MENISRMLSLTLKENMKVSEIIDVLAHIEKECNQNNMKLHSSKILSFVDENAFKPIELK